MINNLHRRGGKVTCHFQLENITYKFYPFATLLVLLALKVMVPGIDDEAIEVPAAPPFAFNEMCVLNLSNLLSASRLVALM